MDKKLWYSKSMKQWRWSLFHSGTQSSGSHYDLHDAMSDIKDTVENMVKSNVYEGQ